MIDRGTILRVLADLRTSQTGVCGISGECPYCPLSKTNHDGPCGRLPKDDRYRVRKLEYLVRFLQTHEMQDILDANPWVLTLTQDEDAYYASMPL